MSYSINIQATVPAKAGTVWEIIAKGDKVNEWFTGVITACRLEGSGEGAKRFCTLMGTDALEERILAIDHAARIFTYAIDIHPMPATELVASMQVKEREAGVEVTWTATFEAASESDAKVVKDMLTELYRQGIQKLGAAGRAQEILSNIKGGLEASGLNLNTLSAQDLSPADQFHIRGAAGTHDMIAALSLSATDHILDIGSGLGGPARLIESSIGCKVTGIDKNPVMVRVARTMSDWTALGEQTTFVQGDATDLPFGDDTFDHIVSQHVYMFIEDPAEMFREAFRVLKPGGTLALYDPAKGAKAALNYPVPWAQDETTDKALSIVGLRVLLEQAGFTQSNSQNVSDQAIDWFKSTQDRTDTPPALGLHLVAGPEFSIRIKNVLSNLVSGATELHLITAQKA